MSGRGRGRGRGRGAAPPSVANAATTFSTPIATLTTFPLARFPSVSLSEARDPSTLGDSGDLEAVNFTEELRYYMHKQSPAYLISRGSKGALAPPKIDRYSDKYIADARSSASGMNPASKINSIITDLRFFPEELRSVYQTGPQTRQATTYPAEPQASFLDTLARIKDLERKDEDSNNLSSQADCDDEDEVVYEEEELEDETDYNLTYFDNGEDYGDYDDGDGILHWIA